MKVIDKLAYSLDRRDEGSNLELSIEIVKHSDKEAIAELVENLSNKNSSIRSNCIKVLYEIGNLKPSLISDYTVIFLKLLDEKENRLQWGAMTTLSCIVLETPEIILPELPKLADVANSGSVITRDKFVNILIKLCSVKEYIDEVFGFLDEQLLSSPTNQLPMYAENMLSVAFAETHKAILIKTLTWRLGDLDKESKRKRVEKVLKKLRGG